MPSRTGFIREKKPDQTYKGNRPRSKLTPARKVAVLTIAASISFLGGCRCSGEAPAAEGYYPGSFVADKNVPNAPAEEADAGKVIHLKEIVIHGKSP
ncbi:MAG: hypothetical protein ABII71_00125 [Candidatus Micrarchaeota archaeon]